MSTKFVVVGRLGASGKPHVEILEMPTSQLPDGVGFGTRSECKDHHRRDPSAPPLWLSGDTSKLPQRRKRRSR